MKKYILFGLLITALTAPINTHAQDRKPAFHRDFFNRDKDCTPLSEMNITDEQQAVIAQKNGSYKDQVMADKVLLLAKRLEFERMLNNSEIDEGILIDMAEEIGILSGKVEMLKLKLLIDIHQTLTPPQIETWCPSIGKAPGKGKSRRPY